MKSMLKKTGLLGLLLLLVFSVVGIIGVTNAVNGQNLTTIETNPSSSNLHWPSLFSLYLGDQESWLNVTSEDFLSVLNGLIVGKGHNVNSSVNSSQLVVIGGGSNNTVSASNAGIGGGSNNTVSASNAGIGGGFKNNVEGNGGVVVGGSTNKAGENGVVVGGYNNNDNKGVVLGGQNNKAGVNSLVLGLKNVNGGDNSFLWNNNNCNPARGECPSAQNDAAMITATNGVLIGTYNAKQGMALVVNGAVKLGGDGQNLSEKGEINVDVDGCVKVIDENGGSVHVLGKTSESQCNAGKSCQFGKTKLQDGETIPQNGDNPRAVKAYSVPYDEDCRSKRVSVTCDNGNLSTEAYPYCYKIDPKSNPTNPVIN